MKATADHYYETQALMDVRLLSTYGFSENDVAALRARADVAALMPVWGADLLVEHPEGSEAARFNALPANTGDNNPDFLNRPVLTEGRLPQRADECLVDNASAYRLGDVVRVSGENSKDALEQLRQREFIVVGRGESPYYISFQRGNTNIGNGRISYFVYLTPDAFEPEPYTDLYLRVAGAEALSSFAEDYELLVDAAAEDLEGFAAERTPLRLEEVRTEAEEELADARRQLAEAQEKVDDGKAELADGRRELEDGRKEADEKLAEAWQEILDGEAKLADGKREIAENEQKLVDAEAEISTAGQTLAEARTALEAGQKDYDTGRTELDKRWAEWQKGKDTYDAKAAEYESGRAAYEAGLAEYQAGAAQLDGLDAAVEGIRTAVSGLEGLLAQMAAGTPGAATQFEQTALQAAGALRQIAEGLVAAGMEGAEGLNTAASGVESAVAQKAYELAYGTLAAVPGSLQPGLDAARGRLDAARAELDVSKALLDGAKSQLDAGKAELDAGKSQLDAAEAELTAAKKTLDEGWAGVRQGEWDLAQAKRDVETGTQQLQDARVELADAGMKLADGKREYEEQKAEVEQELADAEKELEDGERELADAEQELADAEVEISDGQKKLDELEEPEWFVFTREDNPGYAGFASDTGRIDAIAVVIPVFFFLVAALVCLTTMTRMVEEQRTMIGTLKALGYGPASIATKYVGYAAIAGIAGGAAGVAIGFLVFPLAIWEAYGIMYIMPALRVGGNFWLGVGSVAVAVLCTAVATLASCVNELRSPSAELLRQKAPRPGKRVILERIGPLWRHMSFMAKVTARNLLRYKKRFFMTVIGVAGCTGLLLTGFGLRDSITGIVGRQFGADGINRYDLMVALSDASSAEADSPLNALLPELGEGLYVKETLIDAGFEGEKNSGMTTYLYVAEDPDALPQFVRFAERKSGAEIAFPQGAGAVITEKLADRLGAKAGDSIEVNRAGEKPVSVQVAGVAENYVYNYVYITPEAYAALFGEAPEYDTVVIRQHADAQLKGEAAMNALLEMDGVAGGMEISAMKEQFDDMFASLNAVVWVIIAAAGLLAFVVLYNLTNINITERARELATLKVLGFHTGEVASYVFRENLLLTLIGIAVGLVLGVFLHRFVIVTAEIDEVMFRRVVEPLSYAWSVLFTLASAGLVNLVMMPRLRKVNMVESLKAAE